MTEAITRGRCLCGKVASEYQGLENLREHCRCPALIAYGADRLADGINFYAASLEHPPWIEVCDNLPRHARTTSGHLVEFPVSAP